MLIRLGLFFMWLVQFLPWRLVAAIGHGLGMVFYWLGRERRRVARINLRRCFPELGDTAREKLVRAHFRAFGRSLMERGILWWSSPARLKKYVTVSGLEHIPTDRPVIILAPHFLGLDVAWSRLTLERHLASVYAEQKNETFDAVLLQGRSRFNDPLLISRLDGLRGIVKALKSGVPFYYLPDLDYGPRDAIFVPFFGVPAATITGLSRLAKLAGAVVVPCVTRQLPGGRYSVTLLPAWDNYPTGDVEADTRRQNDFIEQQARTMPEQYYWLHKRFKTRPEGEPRFYD